MRDLIRGLVLIGAVVFAGAANAQSLRCGGDLVREEDSMADVIAACGAPDFEDRWVAGAAGLLGFGPPMIEWTYNPGPRRLIQSVLFRGDRVMDVRQAGYGFRAYDYPASGDCEPGLIVPGETKYRLLHLCGRPISHVGWYVTATRAYEPGYSYSYGVNGGQLVYRERWTYDFGPNRLRRIIQLDNARVVDITLGDRGR